MSELRIGGNLAGSKLKIQGEDKIDSTTTDKIFKFSYETIGQIGKLIQMAMLTRTDIADHMRVMELCEENGELFLTEEYGKKHEEYIQRLLDKATEFTEIQKEIDEETKRF